MTPPTTTDCNHDAPGVIHYTGWLGGLRYFVLSGPKPPSTVYRLQPDGELELMLSCGWTASITTQMTGLFEVSEGAARFIWERIFLPPNS
jgi:hypothetical protein